MKWTIYSIRAWFDQYVFAFIVPVLSMILLTAYGIPLTAQSDMNADGLFHRINYDIDFIWFQRKIPNVSDQEIVFVLNGGDGGRRVVPGMCKVKGGEGATVTATFSVGTAAGQLQPGGRIRFIPGGRGTNNRNNGVSAGGGGAGTAILYTTASDADIDCTEPSLNMADASTCWVLLAVAGGGGGAYSSGLCGGSAGKGGNDGTRGTDGKGLQGFSGGSDGRGGGW